MNQGELLLYCGIVIMVTVALVATAVFAGLKMKKKRLDKELLQEYGKKRH